MRRMILVTASILALWVVTLPQTAMGQSDMVDGQVTKIDESAGKITIRHGPFKKFDMQEPMTMVYAVQDPAMLKSMKAGDKVTFDADRIDGRFTVTKIQKVR